MKNLKKLTILHSNDMHGDFLAEQIDENLVGGVSFLSGYVNQVRKQEKNVIWQCRMLYSAVLSLTLFGAHIGGIYEPAGSDQRQLNRGSRLRAKSPVSGKMCKFPYY